MKIKDVIEVIEEWAPISYAEDFDNVGLLIGNPSTSFSKALITLDTIERVVDEAILKECNLIISFHPIIFSPLKKLTYENYVERTVIKAIENKISVYAIHTSLDNHKNGVNYKICEKLEIKNSEILIPKEENKSIGMGRIGNLTKSMTESKFLDFVKTKMKTKIIRHSKLLKKRIHKVAVLGGSGSFAVQNAIQKKADVFITSDLKYHNFYEANNKLLLLDIGHYESEQFTKNLIHDYLTKKFPNFGFILASTKTNPVNYF
ncbi:MAG: Nif3-like dinuclear metal center hexameric protein [Flavobacteriaceae bacterium]|nr:Nif3-like dinuclear metal center hexameric protein [Flavobacteriaceae bacterium]|tara:strand:+ start:5478 stop:6260 length:783 start_codon:yes stop_codon:yes gene_type:complete